MRLVPDRLFLVREGPPVGWMPAAGLRRMAARGHGRASALGVRDSGITDDDRAARQLAVCVAGGGSDVGDAFHGARWCEATVQLAQMGVSTIGLATAVARAGGLGTISSAWLGAPERAGRAIDAIGDVAPGALAVNVLVCMPERWT